MPNKNLKEVIVDKKVVPLHFNKRASPILIKGNNYYICFGFNKATPCVLLNILDGDKQNIEVQIGIRNTSPLGYGDINVVKADEIGETPEQAVLNCQTF